MISPKFGKCRECGHENVPWTTLKEEETTVYTQERPVWCPHQECRFKRRAMDNACCGHLPEPAEHDGDFNSHRLCLNGAADNGGVFDLQMNNTDLWWLRFLFDALDGKDTANTRPNDQDQRRR